MESADILAELEVKLSPEVLNDLVTPGKVFKTDIGDVQVPPAGLDLRSSVKRAPLHRVQLEKISDSLITLFVTGTFSSHSLTFSFFN